jgi:hypothetical protein
MKCDFCGKDMRVTGCVSDEKEYPEKRDISIENK